QKEMSLVEEELWRRVVAISKGSRRGFSFIGAGKIGDC
ncbi:hypothetical protein A2U01_0010344, partial [Trifolium medium]|nr:hypothetical protein [Trifolium medium]